MYSLLVAILLNVIKSKDPRPRIWHIEGRPILLGLEVVNGAESSNLEAGKSKVPLLSRIYYLSLPLHRYVTPAQAFSAFLLDAEKNLPEE